jgi:hypothetical protein
MRCSKHENLIRGARAAEQWLRRRLGQNNKMRLGVTLPELVQQGQRHHAVAQAVQPNYQDRAHFLITGLTAELLAKQG